MSRRSSAIEWRTQRRLIRRSSAGSNGLASRCWIVTDRSLSRQAVSEGPDLRVPVPGSPLDPDDQGDQYDGPERDQHRADRVDDQAHPHERVRRLEVLVEVRGVERVELETQVDVPAGEEGDQPAADETHPRHADHEEAAAGGVEAVEDVGDDAR